MDKGQGYENLDTGQGKIMNILTKRRTKVKGGIVQFFLLISEHEGALFSFLIWQNNMDRVT